MLGLVGETGRLVLDHPTTMPRMSANDFDLGQRSVTELLTLHASVLTELIDREIIGSRNAPGGDYAETLVGEAYGPGSDVQVRCRVIDADDTASQSFSPIRTADADAVFVVLDAGDYHVTRAVEVSADDLPGQGKRLTVQRAFAIEEGRDVTDRLRAAQRRVDERQAPESATQQADGIPVPQAPRWVPEPVDLPAVPTAVVRRSGVTMAGIRDVFDTGFALLAASGVTPTGPAFAVYYGDPSSVFDIEVGFPVAEPVTVLEDDLSEVVAATLPAGPALALSHIGGYEGLGPAWGRLFGTLAGSGLTQGVGMVEVYVTEPGPDADPDTMRTDLFLPLAAGL